MKSIKKSTLSSSYEQDINKRIFDSLNDPNSYYSFICAKQFPTLNTINEKKDYLMKKKFVHNPIPGTSKYHRIYPFNESYRILRDYLDQTHPNRKSESIGNQILNVQDALKRYPTPREISKT